MAATHEPCKACDGQSIPKKCEVCGGRGLVPIKPAKQPDDGKSSDKE